MTGKKSLSQRAQSGDDRAKRMVDVVGVSIILVLVFSITVIVITICVMLSVYINGGYWVDGTAVG